MCAKVGYVSRGDAMATARWFRQHRHSRTQRPYRCQECGWWHLSTVVSKGKKAAWRVRLRRRAEEHYPWWHYE